MDKEIKICFIGTVNAMPMMYAKLFKENNYSVKYIVDVPADEQLSRPENHFQDIFYPYASWIKEIVIKRPSIKTLFPKFFFRSILKETSDCNVFFLNDWYISLAPFLPKDSCVVVISSGADLHTWCNSNMAESVASVGSFKSLSFIKSKIARAVIKNMRKGLACANVVTYFPKGMNGDADFILDECSKRGAKIIRRYDVDTSLVDIKKFSKLTFETDSTFRICSAVRFDYIAEDGAPNNCLKGNDLIIKGIAKFHNEVSSDVSVVFFEKGQHVNEAKKLCEEYGISGIVEWRKTVPLNELLDIMYQSDVCFDQVGSHWIGAVGIYALLLDKPLIANSSDDELFASNCEFKPILKSSTIEDVYMSLCSVYEGGGVIKDANRNFALSKFGPHKVFEEYKFFIDSYFR